MRSGRGATITSLFCGCGGFDLGFLEQGFEPLGAFDVDPESVRTYNLNFSHKADVADLKDWRSMHLGRPDVIIAGPPCQGFSTIGHRRSNDPRNELLLLPAHITRHLRPKVCIVENVMGVKAGSHAVYWDDMRHRLKADGYQTTEIECVATSFGLPQLRKRHVLIAWRSSSLFNANLQKHPTRTLKTILANIDNVPQHDATALDVGSRSWLIAQRIKQGQKLSNARKGSRAVQTWMIPEVFGETTIQEQDVLETLLRLRRRNRTRAFGDADPVSKHDVILNTAGASDKTIETLLQKGYLREDNDLIDLKHTFNGKYRRLNMEAPSPTVDTRFGDPTCFLHPEEDRGMSVREAARIQGFPDDFTFSGVKRAQLRSIGNAVPPPMSSAIADFISYIIREGRWGHS